ncbi:MAG: hypothetical protein MUP61_06090 [Burkholderiales bacterium]|nr:hypothetical protein [Burkholderiales bacterium]
MYFARIANLQTSDVEAAASFIVVAAVELLCGFGADDLAVVNYAWTASCFYFIVAVLFFYASVRRKLAANRAHSASSSEVHAGLATPLHFPHECPAVIAIRSRLTAIR